MPNETNTLPGQPAATTEEAKQTAATQTTSDETAKTTDATAQTGAATDAAQQPQAQTEKTFTQADVDRIIANRIKSGVKAELKKLTGETDGSLTVEDLQRQLSETEKRAQAVEARESVRDYLADAGNKLNIRAENMRAIEKLVMAEIEYSDDGKPANIKEAVNSVKSLAPTLFVNSSASINAGNGRNGSTPISDMNAFIRQQAGR